MAQAARDHLHGVDGLRAIAVIAVLLFHAFPDAVPGGFIGVDIFFVISGFIITRMYFFRLQNEQISLRQFYIRRIRRLAPAYIAVLAVSTVAAYFLLSPVYLKNYGESLAAQPLYLQNIVFWLQGDYFDDAHTKPLLHTWSLAIEEQFYLLYGLLILLARAKRAAVLPVLVLCAIASLAGGLLVSEMSPKTAFYWLPSRVWELAAGVLLGMAYIPLSEKAAMLLRLAGLLAIAAAIAMFDQRNIFPGLQAILACGGTVGVLAALSARQRKDMLLDQPLASYIGQTSYSLYLWHWPVISLAGISVGHQLSVMQGIAALAVTFILASLSYRYIEVPFRKSILLPVNWKLVRSVAVSGLLTVGVALLFSMTEGAAYRYPAKLAALYSAQLQRSPYRCPILQRLMKPGQEMCSRNDVVSDSNVLIVGDSHADQLDELVASIGEARNVGVFLATRNCNLHDFGTSAFCSDKVLGTMLEQSAERKITSIISISFLKKDFDNEQGLKAAVDKVIHHPASIKNVFIMQVVPNNAYFDPKEYISAIENNKNNPDVYTINNYRADNGKQISALHRIAESSPGIKILDPSLFICPQIKCQFESAGRPNYFDPHHLSPTGVKLLAPLFTQLINEIVLEKNGAKTAGAFP